ncbi:MAG: response regulator transcription factor, partial [Campylobacteraceae bacterium]|nr:response regulator transcription factor [Campylobacteraceae bacterium]
LMEATLKNVFKEVYTAKNGDEGVKKFKKLSPNIVVTDIAMPIMDGLDMTKNIKSFSPNTPIIALSAFSEKEKLLKAIDVGIDKYLLKPIDMDDLLCAIKELAKKRIFSVNEAEFGDGLKFNYTTKQLTKNGEEIKLTKKELAFVSLLAQRLGTLVLHEDIKKNVWGTQNVNDAAIRTFIKRIRDKIGHDTIENVSGLGYKMGV